MLHFLVLIFRRHAHRRCADFVSSSRYLTLESKTIHCHRARTCSITFTVSIFHISFFHCLRFPRLSFSPPGIGSGQPSNLENGSVSTGHHLGRVGQQRERKCFHGCFPYESRSNTDSNDAYAVLQINLAPHCRSEHSTLDTPSATH